MNKATDDIKRFNTDQIIYGSYVKHNKLDQLVYDAFSNTSIADATNLNIFVDLYSVLKPVFSEHYRTDIPALTIITSCLINLCGHYRSFFRSLKVNTTFYMIYSDNTSDINRKLVAGYNDSFLQKSQIKQYRDFVNSNFDMLNLLCPYLPDIHFIRSTENYEVAVIIAGIIEKLNDGNPNLIISKDLYPLQLTTLYPYTSYLFPLKSRFGDESIMIPISEKLSFRKEFWNLYTRKRHSANLENLMKISPCNFSLYSALFRFPERNISRLADPRKAVKIIQSIVGEEDIRINSEILNSNEEILNNYPLTISRFNALDVLYSLYYYKASPEYKSLQFINLRDDAKINQICSMDVFVNNPIDLNSL